eukprot:Selendium_serpulae@DN7841_c0_g1_i1.p2
MASDDVAAPNPLTAALWKSFDAALSSGAAPSPAAPSAPLKLLHGFFGRLVAAHAQTETADSLQVQGVGLVSELASLSCGVPLPRWMGDRHAPVRPEVLLAAADDKPRSAGGGPRESGRGGRGGRRGNARPAGKFSRTATGQAAARAARWAASRWGLLTGRGVHATVSSSSPAGRGRLIKRD